MSDPMAMQALITDFQQLVVQSDGASVASVTRAGRLLWAECSVRQASPALFLCMEYARRWGSLFLDTVAEAGAPRVRCVGASEGTRQQQGTFPPTSPTSNPSWLGQLPEALRWASLLPPSFDVRSCSCTGTAGESSICRPATQVGWEVQCVLRLWLAGLVLSPVDFRCVVLIRLLRVTLGLAHGPRSTPFRTQAQSSPWRSFRRSWTSARALSMRPAAPGTYRRWCLVVCFLGKTRSPNCEISLTGTKWAAGRMRGSPFSGCQVMCGGGSRSVVARDPRVKGGWRRDVVHQAFFSRCRRYTRLGSVQSWSSSLRGCGRALCSSWYRAMAWCAAGLSSSSNEWLLYCCRPQVSALRGARFHKQEVWTCLMISCVSTQAPAGAATHTNGRAARSARSNHLKRSNKQSTRCYGACRTQTRWCGGLLQRGLDGWHMPAPMYECGICRRAHPCLSIA